MPKGTTERQLSTASRRAFLTGSAGAVTASIAGCIGGGNSGDGNGSGGTSSGGGKTITILASAASPAEKKVWNSLSKDFKAETGHTVEWKYAGFGEHVNRLSSMIRGGNAPDLTSWNSASGGNAVVEGIVDPLTDVYEHVTQERGTKIQDSFLMKEDDELWFLPNAMYLHNQNIRGDLVSQVGHEFHPEDITFDEHLAWVQDINEQTNTGGWGGATTANNCSAQTTSAYLFQNGVDIYQGLTDSIEVIIDKGKNKERTVEVLKHLAAASKTGPSGASWSWGDLSSSFVSASTSSINYPYGRILQSTLDRDAPWAPGGVNWSEPPHGGRSKEEQRGLAALFGWSLIKAGENKEAAKEFLKFFFTSEYYINFLHTVPLHYSPVLEDVWDSEKYLNNDLIQEKSEVIDLQREMASRARVPALSADNASFNPVAVSAQKAGDLGRMVAQVIHKGTSPEQAVTNAAKNLRGHE